MRLPAGPQRRRQDDDDALGDGPTPPTSGRIVWKGTDIAGWSPHRVARAGIGFVPEDRRVFAELSGVGEPRRRRAGGRRPGQWNPDAVYDLFPEIA